SPNELSAALGSDDAATSAVPPSDDSASVRPNPVPWALIPVSGEPCRAQEPPERTNTRAWPFAFGLPTAPARSVLPSAESAIAPLNPPRGGDSISCCHPPPVRTSTQTCDLPATTAVRPSAERATFVPKSDELGTGAAWRPTSFPPSCDQ